MDEDKELTVGDIMTRGVICVDVLDTVKGAAEVMSKNDISAVMVTEKGKGVGIITERDITKKIVAEGENPKNIPSRDIMTSPIITVAPDASIDDAARLMRDNDIRRLIVEYDGKIVGVLSEFDIVRIEPALHMLIREKVKWSLAKNYSAGAGSVTGACEECENYSESLRIIDGRMVCEDCLSE
ncbi:MAG: CBS domain-containing protein [Candidatus Altiarchaeota archaeon]